MPDNIPAPEDEPMRPEDFVDAEDFEALSDDETASISDDEMDIDKADEDVLNDDLDEAKTDILDVEDFAEAETVVYDTPMTDDDLEADMEAFAATAATITDEDIIAPEDNEEITIGEINREPDRPVRTRAHHRESSLTESPGREREKLQEFAPEMVRQQRTGRLAMFPLALGMIVPGLLLLASRTGQLPELEITVSSTLVILFGALTLTFLFRFFLSGRRERGLFFIALVLMMWGIVLAMTILAESQFPINEYYPLFIGGTGIAFIFTFLFERTHQVGLVLPGLVLIVASGIALTVTRDLLSQDMRDVIADYYPLLFTLIGLTLLPLVLRRKSRQNV